MLLSELPIELLIALFSFIANSIFLTFYFSNVLSDFASKHAPRKDAFLLSVLGSAVGAAFSLVVPFLPDIFPFMDVAVALVIITWVLLLHYHYENDWLEAAFEAGIAALLYVVILAITTGLLILWIRIS